MSEWRTITADQYRVGGDASGDFDEVFIKDANGFRREVWDVGIDCDEEGNVHIYTAAAEPLVVPKDYPLRVR